MVKIIVIGAGGHSKVIQDIIYRKNYSITAILDDKYSNPRKQDNDIITAPISYYSHFLDGDYRFFIAIGDNDIRKTVTERLNINEEKYITLIHPNAVIGSKVKIGEGTVVMAGVIVNTDTTIGKHSILNSGAVIEHDNIIGDFAHISPNTSLAGRVKIGVGAHIGIGSSIIPQITVGEWTKVGAGAVVINNLPPNCTAVGVPAKTIKFHDNRFK